MAEEAELAREKGNSLFKQQSYGPAAAQYIEALDLLRRARISDDDTALRESEHKCRLNRAACLLKLQGYGAARRECEAVLAEDGQHAKAHFRLGAALEALGELGAAQKAYTQAAKLDAKLREPREALEALRARTAANPRLEGLLADLAMVEERALRTFNQGDLKRAREQMELALKDARGAKDDWARHWEARALLALALLCQEEGEADAAQQYLAAARRVHRAAADRRAELYTLTTEAAVLLDGGRAADALSTLQTALLLAEELGESRVASRVLGNLAAAHQLLDGSGGGGGHRAIEYGLQALAHSRDAKDRYAEAVDLLNLGRHFRLAGNVDAAKEYLSDGVRLAEGLGYAHLLSVAFGQFGLLQIEHGKAHDHVRLAVDKLKRAADISQANGMARNAVDDAIVLHGAAARWGHATHSEAVNGLTEALTAAEKIGHGGGIRRALAALGLCRARAAAASYVGGGAAAAAARSEAAARRAELPLAERDLARAATLAEEAGDAAMHSEVLGGLALVHALKAKGEEAAAPPRGARTEAAGCAARAREAGEKGRKGAPSARELTNEGAAQLLAAAGDADAAAAACATLEAAVEAAKKDEDAPQEVRASIALGAASEARGDDAAAVRHLRRALEIAPPPAPADAPAAKLQEKLLAVADGYAAGGDAAAALELFKRLLKEFVVLG